MSMNARSRKGLIRGISRQKRRQRMAKKSIRKLLRKTRVQRHNNEVARSGRCRFAGGFDAEVPSLVTGYPGTWSGRMARISRRTRRSIAS